MPTQRILWASISLAILIVGLITYQLMRIADQLPITITVPSKASITVASKPTFDTSTPSAYSSPNVSVPTLAISRQVRPALGVLLRDAVNVLVKQPPNFEAAKAYLFRAEAMTDQTAFERYKVNETWAYLFAREKNYRGALVKYEQLLADAELRQQLSPESATELSKRLALYAAATGEHDKVIVYGQRWLASYPDDHQIEGLIGQSYYRVKNYESCSVFLGSAIAATLRAGGVPPAHWLTHQIACLHDLNARIQLLDAYATLCRFYPTPGNWERYIRVASNNARSPLAIFGWQLLTVDTVGALRTGDDYLAFAMTASNNFQLPTIAAGALESALAAKTIDPRWIASLQNRLRTLIENAKNARGRISSLTTQTLTATTGQPSFELGMIYFDNRQYSQAVDALLEALNKGRLTQPALAYFALGIAQYRVGERDAARSTFALLATDASLAAVTTAWTVRTYN